MDSAKKTKWLYGFLLVLLVCCLGVGGFLLGNYYSNEKWEQVTAPLMASTLVDMDFFEAVMLDFEDHLIELDKGQKEAMSSDAQLLEEMSQLRANFQELALLRTDIQELAQFRIELREIIEASAHVQLEEVNKLRIDLHELGQLRSDVQELTQLRADVQELALLRTDVQDLAQWHTELQETMELSARAELEEINSLRTDVQELGQLGTEVQDIVEARAQVQFEEIRNLRTDVQELAQLRADVQELAQLRTDVQELAQLRTSILELSELRGELQAVIEQRVALQLEEIRELLDTKPVAYESDDVGGETEAEEKEEDIQSVLGATLSSSADYGTSMTNIATPQTTSLRVIAGDSIWSLAARFVNPPTQELITSILELNGITDPRKLQVGSWVTIPLDLY